jgi:hypothetical protein
MIEKRTSLSVREQPLPENEQVAIALRPRTIGPLLKELFRLELEEIEGQSGAPGVSSPAYDCQILDAKYEPGNYCTILYQLGDHLVIGTYEWGSDESPIPETTKVIPSLGMRVYRFPNVYPAQPNQST